MNKRIAGSLHQIVPARRSSARLGIHRVRKSARSSCSTNSSPRSQGFERLTGYACTGYLTAIRESSPDSGRADARTPRHHRANPQGMASVALGVQHTGSNECQALGREDCSGSHQMTAVHEGKQASGVRGARLAGRIVSHAVCCCKASAQCAVARSRRFRPGRQRHPRYHLGEG